MRPMERPSAGLPTMRFEFTCLYCGHDAGEVELRSADRPSYREVRRALAVAPTNAGPAWDAHGEPRCPRCRAKLFVQRAVRRRFVAV